MALSVWNDNKILKKWIKKNQKQFFDGNLNFNMMDLYSDPLLKAISERLKINKKYIYLGAGSSQFIPSIIGLNCWNKIYLSTPEFGLYTRAIRALKTDYEEIFSKTCSDFIEIILHKKTSDKDLLIISSPRWFSGEKFSEEQIKKLISNFKGNILIDEAYVSFSDNPNGMIDVVLKNDRLMVLRSFSEKYFLSGLRIGYLITKKSIDGLRDTIIPPHSISTYSARLCVNLLGDDKILKAFENANECIKTNRDCLYDYLKSNTNIEIFKSEANFITFIVNNKKYYDFCKDLLSGLSGIQFFQNDNLSSIKIWIANKDLLNEVIRRFNSQQ